MTTSVPAYEKHGLVRLGGRPPLVRYLEQTWERRHFMLQLAWARFQSENEQDRLGIGWVVLRPLMNAAVYGAIFGLLLARKTRPDNFVAFLVTGVFFFQYFASCLSEGARAITSNMGLVRTLHFPRVLLPLATVLKQAYAMVAMVVVLIFIVLITGEPLTVNWLLAFPVLAMMTLFNCGVAFIAARLTIHVRDIAQLLPFLTRLLFYVSGIFYKISTTIHAPAPIEKAFELNPLNIYISLSRGALIENQTAPWHFWYYGAIWAVLFAVVGFVFFWRAEERYGRE